MSIIYHKENSCRFPGGSDSKESTCNAEDPGSIRQSGRSPGEGNGNPLQYSCLENPRDSGAWWVTINGVAGVRHNLVTKPPHVLVCVSISFLFIFLA